MATISRELWQVYHTAVNNQAANAADYMRNVLTLYIHNHPRASVEAIRNFAIEALKVATETYGELTGSVSGLMYDLTTDYLGLTVDSADLFETMPIEQAEKIAHYQATKLVKGNIDEFIRQMARAAEDSVRWQANSTVIMNVNREKDKKAGIRFARVVSGSETCSFCMMLASQGFVYQSRKEALYKKDGVSRYHHGCRCGVIAGLPDTKLEGYDTQRIYDRWQALKAIEEQTDKTWAEREVEKAELVANDPVWKNNAQRQSILSYYL